MENRQAGTGKLFVSVYVVVVVGVALFWIFYS